MRSAVLTEQIDVAPLERSIRGRVGKRVLPRWAVPVAAGLAIIIAGGQSRTCALLRRCRGSSAIQFLAEKQGLPPSAIAAIGTTSYSLERARLCFLKKQIFLHLVYTRDGEEFSVYRRLRGSQSPFDGSVREASLGPEDLADFQTDRLAAVVVSRQGALTFAVKQLSVLQ